MSLRTRLATIFSVLAFIAVLIAGSVMLSNARFAIQKEVASSRIIAQNLIEESLRHPPMNETIENSLKSLPIKFRHIRHVRISVSGPNGTKLKEDPTFSFAQEENDESAPDWFLHLLKPATEITTITVMFSETSHGTISIIPEPSHEIDEIWQDVLVLSKIAIATFISLIVAIYIALGIALKPLSEMTAALKAMEEGDYDVNIPPLNSIELTNLGAGINALTRKLDLSYKERDKLNRHIISVQDHERRFIALELHDEFGPCHFGVKVNATALSEYFGKQEGEDASKYADKANSILDIVNHMEACNRDLLDRLRPMALGVVDLSTLLTKLVSTFKSHDNTSHDTSMKWNINIDDNLGSYGETIDLTAYRVIQGSLTNVIRHAGASEVTVTVALIPGSNTLKPIDNSNDEKLFISITDNGCGFSKHSNPGHGISGVKERIAALAGSFSISNNHPNGTIVEAELSIPQAGFDWEQGLEDTNKLTEKPTVPL